MGHKHQPKENKLVRLPQCSYVPDTYVAFIPSQDTGEPG